MIIGLLMILFFLLLLIFKRRKNEEQKSEILAEINNIQPKIKELYKYDKYWCYFKYCQKY